MYSGTLCLINVTMRRRLFTPEIATFYEEFLTSKGITFIKEDTATSFEGKDGKVRCCRKTHDASWSLTQQTPGCTGQRQAACAAASLHVVVSTDSVESRHGAQTGPCQRSFMTAFQQSKQAVMMCGAGWAGDDGGAEERQEAALRHVHCRRGCKVDGRLLQGPAGLL